MEDFYRPSLIGRGGPIVPETNFALKNHMVKLLRQIYQFHGFKEEDANEHLDKYLSITQFIKQNGVSQDIINLNLFRFSLTHEAESWFYTLKTHYIHTWEEMVFKFLSKYYPYSRALQLRKEFFNFQQLPTESVFEAWERFKSYSDESDNYEPSEMIEDQKSIHHLSGSPTPSSDPVTNTLLPHHDSTSPEVDDDIFDLEGDILFLEGLLNDEISSDLPPLELNIDLEGDILFLENLLKDEPLEKNKSEINPLIREPSNTFLMGDNEIELNSHEDIDDLVPIPRISEKPLDSLDSISKTFDMTITDPLFDFDSEFTLNSDNPIFGIHNEESDESETETIIYEVQNHSPQGGGWRNGKVTHGTRRKRISEKRMKNQAKNNKTEHEMEKRESQSRSQRPKSQQSKSKPKSKKC
ncbi:reverse transcriptase domain-containing protein [Tanacetum coccineum]